MNTDTHIAPRWLTIRQAAAYGPYGEKRLVDLIREGKLRGCQLSDNGRRPWIIDRLSLDEYVEAQMAGGNDRQKILAFVKGWK